MEHLIAEARPRMTGPTMTRNDTTDSTARTPAHVTRRRYDWTEIHPTTAIIETVARSLDHDPVELDQLSSVVDTDAIDSLLMNATRPGRQDIELSLTYEGHDVTAKSSGMVTAVSLTHSD